MYSLIGRDYEGEPIPLAADHGVGAVVWSPLGWGRLARKVRRDRFLGVSRMSSLMDGCVSVLGEMLASIEWTRVSRRHDVFRHVAPGTLVWQLAANGTTDRRTGSVSFLPALGVRHSEAADIEGDFLGLPKSSSRFTATTGCGLMDLLPSDGPKVSERWCVSDDAEIEQVMAIVSEDFSRYGLSFYQRFASVDSLVEYLSGHGRTQDQNGKLAILYALSGCAEDALSALSDYVDVAKRQSPPISVQSWKFVKSFVGRFDIGESLLNN
jgi:hypothetical protein